MSPAPSENSLTSDEHVTEMAADAMSRTSLQTEVEGVSSTFIYLLKLEINSFILLMILQG
jgi:hypothetical protein